MRKITLLVLPLFFLTPLCRAYPMDFPHRCDSDYFTIYYQDGVDPLGIAYDIQIGGVFYLYQDANKSIVPGGDPEDILAENVDDLFTEVSDILDIHLYSYHGDIKICSNKEELEKVFSERFDQELETESFYHNEENTIYITKEGLKPGILAHEMAQVIVSHYFVILPPAKVQEVLSEYVEVNLNKKLQIK
ncbi:MAG: hypothetical protein P9M06_07435 [Candidatus Saelkia tenebricola]|nr:hypothetical protein [Candidatus Saelkia tenebricola]